LARTREGDVEHQYRTGLHVYHSGRRFPELDCPLAAEELTTAFIHEANPDGVNADFGSAASDPEHQMRPRVYRGKVREPYVLEHAQHAQLALLVNEGVVGYDCKIEMQIS
jgi:hypothetical protein